MGHTFSRILLHVIFSTKERRPFIAENIQAELNAYLAGALRNIGCPAILVGSVEDHVHALFALSKNLAISQVVKEVKVESSKWMKTKGPGLKAFCWQSGYGAFSVSQSMVQPVRAYIAGQKAHHRKQTFQQELREFLERHGVEYDERYVWE